MTGLPVMKNDRTGVTALKMRPYPSPQEIAVSMRQVLTMGPVMKTLVFLRNILAIQTASISAAIVSFFTLVFIS